MTFCRSYNTCHRWEYTSILFLGGRVQTSEKFWWSFDPFANCIVVILVNFLDFVIFLLSQSFRFALLGGTPLHIMPCVCVVLSMSTLTYLIAYYQLVYVWYEHGVQFFLIIVYNCKFYHTGYICDQFTIYMPKISLHIFQKNNQIHV